MKPALVHPPGKPELACLIDLHATAYAEHVEGATLPPGKLAHVALKAVAIRHLRPGEFANLDGTEYPCPAQVAATSAWTAKSPMHRGIFPDAAAALLAMNHGLGNSIAPGEPFQLANETAGFHRWSFALAWAWSAWQAKHRQGDLWPLKRRWENFRDILDYPDSEGAFRQLCSRLGLSVTKSRPIL